MGDSCGKYCAPSVDAERRKKKATLELIWMLAFFHHRSRLSDMQLPLLFRADAEELGTQLLYTYTSLGLSIYFLRDNRGDVRLFVVALATCMAAHVLACICCVASTRAENRTRNRYPLHAGVYLLGSNMVISDKGREEKSLTETTLHEMAAYHSAVGGIAPTEISLFSSHRRLNGGARSQCSGGGEKKLLSEDNQKSIDSAK